MIVLLTDFGLKDGYVGTMKGVIKSINSKSEIIDLSHDIKPQNIQEAAYVLWSSYKYFPKNTVFLCVVDPGVGSSRKILGIKTERHIFIAPDNGVLQYILSAEKQIDTYEITKKSILSGNVSNTFHGRDIFAPLAAFLDGKANLKSFGKKISVERYNLFVDINNDERKYEGKIIHIDKFGNAISNILLPGKIYAHVKISNKLINCISESYFNSKDMELIALKNSSNLLEVASGKGNAAKIFKIKVGMKITMETLPFEK